MIKLELFDPNTEETKVHQQGFVSSRKLRKALEVFKNFEAVDEEGNPKVDEIQQMDIMVAYIANDLFDAKEVTEDAIWDGVPSTEFSNTLTKILNEVVGNDETVPEDVKKGK